MFTYHGPSTSTVENGEKFNCHNVQTAGAILNRIAKEIHAQDESSYAVVESGFSGRLLLANGQVYDSELKVVSRRGNVGHAKSDWLPSDEACWYFNNFNSDTPEVPSWLEGIDSGPAIHEALVSLSVSLSEFNHKLSCGAYNYLFELMNSDYDTDSEPCSSIDLDALLGDDIKEATRIHHHALASRVLAVAVITDDGNGNVFDWACYVDSVPGFCHANEKAGVALNGSKQSEKLAREFFPYLNDIKYRS